MRSRQSSTDVQFPRFSKRRTTMLHQSSLWFNQLVCYGVPWRSSSYAGRSTTPGCLGQVGAARARACLPVCSSVRMPGPPWAAMAGACEETSHTARTWAANATGASGFALSQYATRCGCQAAGLSQTPTPTGAARLDHPAFAALCGHLTGCPMADGAPRRRRLFPRDRDHRDQRCCRTRGGRARAWALGHSLHEHRGEGLLRAPIGFQLLQLRQCCPMACGLALRSTARNEARLSVRDCLTPPSRGHCVSSVGARPSSHARAARPGLAGGLAAGRGRRAWRRWLWASPR